MPWYAWLLLALQLIFFVWLFVLSRKSKKTDEIAPMGREDKIFQLYSQIEEMLDNFESYVGEMHTQLEDKRTELIELNRQAQVVYLQALEGGKPAEPENILSAPIPVPAPAPQPKAAAMRKQGGTKEEKRSRLTDKDKEALGRFATKPQKVRFLMSRGLSIDEVARELDIGKGEVLLIADLDKT